MKGAVGFTQGIKTPAGVCARQASMYSIPNANSRCICKNLEAHKRQMRKAKFALAGGYLAIAGICVGGLYLIA